MIKHKEAASEEAASELGRQVWEDKVRINQMFFSSLKEPKKINIITKKNLENSQEKRSRVITFQISIR